MRTAKKLRTMDLAWPAARCTAHADRKHIGIHAARHARATPTIAAK